MAPRLAVVSHITYDTILAPEWRFEGLGGPPLYAGLTALRLGCRVSVVTRVGYDFRDEDAAWVARNRLEWMRGFLDRSKPTTRFRLELDREGSRRLFLQARCSDIGVEQLGMGDGAIVSPVAGEVSGELLREVGQAYRYTYLDPQGFVRRIKSGGLVEVQKVDITTLSGLDIVKVDSDEAWCLTCSRDPLATLRAIHRQGVGIVIYTQGSEGAVVGLEGRVFQVPAPSVEVKDTTGLGDILAGGFMATYLGEGDPLWASAVGVTAASLAAQGAGLDKIPSHNEVLEVAEDVFDRIQRISQE
jgi:sugar/nucleoside kinase (ribokinase family)